MKQVLIPFLGVLLLIAIMGFGVKKISNNKAQSTATNTKSSLVKKEIALNYTKVMVEIADTPEARSQGLANRDSLDENLGMIFIFDKKKVSPVFWMKDMKFSIDMVWITDNKIVRIDANVPVPKTGASDKDLTNYRHQKPIDYIVEVNAGFCGKNNIKLGDDVSLTSIFPI